MNFVFSMDAYFILFSGQNLRLTILTGITHIDPRNQIIWIYQWQIVWNQLNILLWQVPDVRKGRGCLGKLQALMLYLNHAKQTVLFLGLWEGCVCVPGSLSRISSLFKTFTIFSKISSLQLSSNRKEQQPNKVLFFLMAFGKGKFLFVSLSVQWIFPLFISLLALFSPLPIYLYFIHLISFMGTKNLGIDHFFLSLTQEVCSFIARAVFARILDLWHYCGR